MIFTTILLVVLIVALIAAIFDIRHLDKKVKTLEVEVEIKQMIIDRLEMNDSYLDELRKPFMEGYLKERNKDG